MFPRYPPGGMPAPFPSDQPPMIPIMPGTFPHHTIMAHPSIMHHTILPQAFQMQAQPQPPPPQQQRIRSLQAIYFLLDNQIPLIESLRGLCLPMDILLLCCSATDKQSLPVVQTPTAAQCLQSTGMLIHATVDTFQTFLDMLSHLHSSLPPDIRLVFVTDRKFDCTNAITPGTRMVEFLQATGTHLFTQFISFIDPAKQSLFHKTLQQLLEIFTQLLQSQIVLDPQSFTDRFSLHYLDFDPILLFDMLVKEGVLAEVVPPGSNNYTINESALKVLEKSLKAINYTAAQPLPIQQNRFMPGLKDANKQAVGVYDSGPAAQRAATAAAASSTEVNKRFLFEKSLREFCERQKRNQEPFMVNTPSYASSSETFASRLRIMTDSQASLHTFYAPFLTGIKSAQMETAADNDHNREEGEADSDEEWCVSTVEYDGIVIEIAGQQRMESIREQAAKAAFEYAHVKQELQRLLSAEHGGDTNIPIATMSRLLDMESAESDQRATKTSSSDQDELKRKLQDASAVAAMEESETAEARKPAVIPVTAEKSSKVLFYEYSTKAKLKPEFEYTTTTDKQPKFGCVLTFWNHRFESRQLHTRKADAKADAIETSLTTLYQALLRKGRLTFNEIDFTS